MKIRKINISEITGYSSPKFPYGTLYLSSENKLLISDGVNSTGVPLPNGTIRGDGYSEIRFVPNSSGDSSGYTTIELRPDLDATSDQYLIVDPTGPNHIHLRAGGTQDASTADLFLGGELNNVQVSDSNNSVTIRGNNYSWTFGNNGDLNLPSGGGINGDGYSEIRFVPNSSGDGAGYTTIELRPDLDATLDQYLIIDPTAPSHIHIRAGGTQDNSNAELFLGGENSHVKVGAGINPPINIKSNENNWLFNTDGNLTLPSTGKIYFNNGTIAFYVTSAPTHSTGESGDKEGAVAFNDGYIYYCTADYNQVGHQVTIPTLYDGGTSINSNSLQLTKTSDTLQITVGDIIQDNLGATSVVGLVSSDNDYTYVMTGPGGGVAFNCQFPLTFTSTDYVPGGNIWKRVAWSNDTW